MSDRSIFDCLREDASKTQVSDTSERFRKAAKARAAALTPEQRRQIARNAIHARWAKREKRPIGFRLEEYSTEELAAGLRNRYKM